MFSWRNKENISTVWLKKTPDLELSEKYTELYDNYHKFCFSSAVDIVPSSSFQFADPMQIDSEEGNIEFFILVRINYKYSLSITINT